MAHIYLVTAGDYSDYRVVAAFTDKTHAEVLAEQFGGYGVEEYELDPKLPSYLKPGYKIYHVWMFSDGELADYGLRQISYELPEGALGTLEFTDFTYPGNSDHDGQNPRTGEWYLCGLIQAKDEKHAVKIANEKRIKILAAGLWPERITDWCTITGQLKVGGTYHPSYPHHHVETPALPEELHARLRGAA